MKILASTAERLKQCDDVFEGILNAERVNSNPADNKEDALRYTLFLMTFADAVKNLHASISILRHTDEEIQRMCRESGVSVETAIHNAHINMMGNIIKDLFEHMGA